MARKPVGRGKAAPAKSKKAKRNLGGVHRGAEGRKRVKEELERSKRQEAARKAKRNEPFRFRLSPGEEKQFIVVDEEPWFFRYEHNMKNPRTGFFDVFLGCVRDYDNCPICEAEGKDGSYNMYLTVIDLTEFEDRQGEVHEFSRKLLVVKSRDQNKFIRRFDAEGTLRGALFETHRDKDTDPAIGNDIEFMEMVPEEELEEYVKEYIDRESKVHQELCHEPFDYDEMYPEKDAEELAADYEAIAGGTAPDPSPGSRRSNSRVNRKAVDDTSEEEDSSEADESDADEDTPWEDESAEDESEEEGGEATDDESAEDDSEEDPAAKEPVRPARGKAGRKAGAGKAPSGRRSARTSRTADTDDGGKPPRRVKRTPAKAGKAPATRRGRRK